jgi:hypothetical protein
MGSMTLTRHTQVENLANLLAARRRQAALRGCRDDAYRRLIAAILDVPVDGVATSALPAEPRSVMTFRASKPQAA